LIAYLSLQPISKEVQSLERNEGPTTQLDLRTTTKKIKIFRVKNATSVERRR
jgi:hypothetical protein